MRFPDQMSACSLRLWVDRGYMSTPMQPRLPPGERLRRVGIASWSIIGALIVGYLALQGLIRISVIFPPLVLALLIIYLVNPVISRLERRGVPRIAGVLVSYSVIVGGITLLVLALIGPISRQVEDFSDQMPQFKRDLAQTVEDVTDGLNDRFGIRLNADQIECLLGADEAGIGDVTEAQCDEVTRDFRATVADQATRVTEIGGTVLEVLLVFVLAPLLALYLLIDLPNLQRDLLNLVPESHRDEFADLGGKISGAVGGFFRGQLLVALIVFLMSAIGFRLIGLPFWLVIAAIAGITNLIPLVGPFIGGGVGLFIGIVSEGPGLGLKAALVALVVQQIDNHIISPNVMKRAVNLHPVTVMLSLLAGGGIAGFWGILLAVPAVAVVKLVAGHLWMTRVLGEEASPYARIGGTGGAPPSVAPERTEGVALSPEEVESEKTPEA
jgi:predicted PurR-regulated permease PerM